MNPWSGVASERAFWTVLNPALKFADLRWLLICWTAFADGVVVVIAGRECILLMDDEKARTD